MDVSLGTARAEEVLTEVGIGEDTRLLNGAGCGDNFAATGYVRFLLAFVVLIGHSVSNCRLNVPPATLWWPDTQAAVCGFFLLSGWVICGSVTRESEGFYLRRLERLLPVYASCLLWSLGPFFVFGHTIVMPEVAESVIGPVSALDVISNFFFLQYFTGTFVNTFLPAWSLSCEVFYYACAPLFYKMTTRWLLALAAASVIAFTLLTVRGMTVLIRDIHGIGVLIMAWPWLTGFIGYRLRKTRPMASILLVVSTAAFWFENSGYLILLAGLAILYGHLVPMSVSRRRLGILLGDLSYPLYLSHYTTLVFMARLLPESFPHRGPVAVAVAIVVAFAFLMLIDRPIQGMFKRGRYRELNVRTAEAC